MSKLWNRAPPPKIWQIVTDHLKIGMLQQQEVRSKAEILFPVKWSGTTGWKCAGGKGRLIWSKGTGLIFLFGRVTNKKLPLFFCASTLYFRNCGSSLVCHKIGFICCGDNLRWGGVTSRVIAIFSIIFVNIFVILWWDCRRSLDKCS